MAITYGKAIQANASSKAISDMVLVAPDEDYFILADGLGEGDTGEQAALLTLTTINSHLESVVSTSRKAILPALTTAYQKATTAIQMKGLNACSSATTVYVHNDVAYIGHVGNTRAYAVSRASIDQLTTDHTMEEKTLEFGMNFTGDSYSPILYRAIGQSDEAADTLIHRFAEKTGLLLISDGVYRAGVQLIEYDDVEDVVVPMDDDTILDVIRKASDAQSACDALIAAANKHGAGDNLSAVFISNSFQFKVDE